jgi:hypothetical protein
MVFLARLPVSKLFPTFALALSACSAPSNQLPSSDVPSPRLTNPSTLEAAGDCASFKGTPLSVVESAETVVLQEAGASLRIEAVVYPLPDYPGKPWSQWGQGLVLEDGRFLSAVGDHLGVDGNAYLYAYDPESGRMEMLGDVLSFAGARPSWGYGKVHGQMVPGPCGETYFTTYWGKKPKTFDGDLLFRIDADLRSIASLGIPVPGHGVPSLAGWPQGGLVYGEAVDPQAQPKAGPFFAYDVGAGRVVFESGTAPHEGFRNVAVDGQGRAYFSAGGGQLTVYDPSSNASTVLSATLPGEWLRASTTPGPDGTIYGVTRQPDMLFALEPSGETRTLGPARGYVASMALHPDGERFFYIPEAHGDTWKQGAPLISVDTQTGEEQVIVELNAMAEATLGLRLGGTYNVVVDREGERIFIGFNAGLPGEDNPFGAVVLVVVHLP